MSPTPRAGASKPGSEKTAAKGGKAAPRAAKPKPEAATAKPRAAKPKPEAAEAKPKAAKPKPEAAKAKPKAAKPKPEAAKAKPKAAKPKPEAAEAKPKVEKPKAKVEKPKPKAEKSKPKVEKPKPGVEKPKPKVETLQPTGGKSGPQGVGPGPRGQDSGSRGKPPTSGEPLRGELPFPLLRRGKVRDVYELSPFELLMVASDRVSAFDVVMKEPVPRKGEVLTQLTAWWLTRLETKGIEHHLIAVHPAEIIERHPRLAKHRSLWEGRAMLVTKTEPIPVECVVRGHLSGSAWKEYQESGTLAGERLPEGMLESQRLIRPLFSPATKATEGHDENITPAEVRRLVGDRMAVRLERLSLRIYDHGRRACDACGILLADTKLEFGMDLDGRLLLIDEVMTPDSSRFWPKQGFAPGRAQPSLDKQPVRDWLDALPDWNKQPPPPELPPEVVSQTTERYLEIFRRLTGTALDDFQPPTLASEVA